MAKVTNGHSFGLTAPEAMICKAFAYGKTEKEIFQLFYHISDESTQKEKTAARRAFQKLRNKEGFDECYRAFIRECVQGLFAQGIKTLGDQINMDATDPKTGYMTQNAANLIMNRWYDSVMNVNSNEVVVRVEGMPVLGKPEDAEAEGADSD